MNNPIVYQRLEGAAIFVAATYIYFSNDLHWMLYLLLLLAFDISIAGYALGPKVGATVYNIVHSLTLPSLLAIAYLVTESPIVLGLVCLWFAHIGMDRALGYGLKLPSGFKHTHLGKIGK